LKKVLITGSGGLVGSEACFFFSNKKFKIIGIENNTRKKFFGKAGDISKNYSALKKNIKNFKNYNVDIRDKDKLEKVFLKEKNKLDLIIHCAAQPSHDYSYDNPVEDFNVNANGTLNLLYLVKKYCKNAVFIFMSTNKVYGDRINYLKFKKKGMRFIPKSNSIKKGVSELMSIDNSMHSVFGASKVAADVLVQEFGKYYGLKTTVLRGGCLTGYRHAGVSLHGFLSHLVKSCVNNKKYNVIGYSGLQVRDNLHAYDLAAMFWHIYLKPNSGAVYNVGGGKFSNCSVLEAIKYAELYSKKKMKLKFIKKPRKGDHKWWITDMTKFKKDYPNWKQQFTSKMIIAEMVKKYSK